MLEGLVALVLFICSYTDIKNRKIYNKLIIPAIVIILVVRLFYHPMGIPYYLWGLAPAVVLFILAFMTNGRAIGGGDILLAAFIGLSLGWIGVFFTVTYCFIGGSIYLLGARLFAKLKMYSIPLAPFFLLGFTLYLTQPYWLYPLLIA